MNPNQQDWNQMYSHGAKFGVHEIVVRLCDLLPGDSRVLDYGCGKGQNAIYLAERGVTVVGFDISDESVRHSREAADQRGLGERTKFFVSDGLDPEIEPGDMFDAVLCSYVLDYLGGGPPKPIDCEAFDCGLGHVKRLVIPGGLAAVSYGKVHIWPKTDQQEGKELDRGYSEDRLREAFVDWEELFWGVGQHGEKQTHWGVKNNLDVQIIARKPE